MWLFAALKRLGRTGDANDSYQANGVQWWPQTVHIAKGWKLTRHVCSGFRHPESHSPDGKLPKVWLALGKEPSRNCSGKYSLGNEVSWECLWIKANSNVQLCWENLLGFSSRTSTNLKLEIFRDGGFLSFFCAHLQISVNNLQAKTWWWKRSRVVGWPPSRCRGDKMSALLRI